MSGWFNIEADPDAFVQRPEPVIAAERAHLGKGPGDELCGLALSGGGIRSASFALGVMEALHENGALDRMDYLSSVSGGGYTGSSYTWFRSRGIDFPFGKRRQGSQTPDPDIATRILSYIRLHGDYMLPTQRLGFASLLGYVSWAMAVSLIIYFLLLFAVVRLLYGLLPDLISGQFPIEVATWSPQPFLWLATGVFSLGLVPSCLAFMVFTITQSRGFYAVRRRFQQVVGGVNLAIFSLLALAAVPLVHDILSQYLDRYLAEMASGAGILSGAGSMLLMLYRAVRGNEAGALIRLSFFPMVVATILVFSLTLAAYVLAKDFFPAKVGSFADVWGPLLLSYFIGSTLDLNRISFHFLYRDRLMEVFMRDWKPDEDRSSFNDMEWRPASEADRAELSMMCKTGPYHLINTNVILTGSNKPQFRSRGGDSFILSPLYCGSTATGYQRTSSYLDGTMTLASAMAISGAAVNPLGGVAGQGPTRNFWVSILLALLNIRLGFWARHPEPQSRFRRVKAWINKVFLGNINRPDFYSPGLDCMLKGGLDERASFVELSDGGHFENTALYELIRRELALIIVSDAGSDPSFTYADLGNAVERVRVDFGTQIEFDTLEADVEKQGIAVGRIIYANRPSGRIIYVKPRMIGGLPVDVAAYQAAHPLFPHEPTYDQFFNERQLESYRELGYQICKRGRDLFR